MSQKLSTRLEQLVSQWARARRQPWASILSLEPFGLVYGAILTQTFHYVRHSVPIMVYAIELGVKPALKEYLERHIAEERNHDEWLLQDLAALGVSRLEALTHQPLPSALALVGAQYQLMRELGGSTVLGYVFYLERMAPREASIKRIRDQHELPSAAVRTFLEHADVDVVHVEALSDIIDQVGTESRVASDGIEYAAKVTAANFQYFSDQLLSYLSTVCAGYRNLQ